MSREEKKALYFAILCMTEVRQKRYSVNSHIYELTKDESQKKFYDKYQELSNAISVLERMINDG